MSQPYALGSFLRARREQTPPESVGLSAGTRRRARGLRREEVAELAGISVDWYTRIEQGRVGLPSSQTLEALMRALAMNARDCAHLRLLASSKSDGDQPSEEVPHALRLLLAGLHQPAYVIGQRWDLLAWNAAAVELFGDFAALPLMRGNLLRYMLIEPQARLVFGDTWEEEARRVVAKFRRSFDQYPDDAGFGFLTDELIHESSEFSAWWVAHDINSEGSGIKRLHHPKHGKQELAYVSLNPCDNPRLRLSIYLSD